MDKERLDELWKQVEHVGKVERLEYDAMVALGSVFGEMKHVIEEQAEKVEQYEKAINQAIEKMNGYDIHRFGDELHQVLKA